MNQQDELLVQLIRKYPKWCAAWELPGYEGGVAGRLLKPLIDEGIVERSKRSRQTIYRLNVYDPEWNHNRVWPVNAVIKMGATDSPQTIGERIQGLLMLNPMRRFCIYREGEVIWLVMMQDRLTFDMGSD